MWFRTKRRFSLGRVEPSLWMVLCLGEGGIKKALSRHASGDWGECGEKLRELNETSVAAGGDLVSVFRMPSGNKFWVITLQGRGKTVVMEAANDEIDVVDDWPE